MKSNALRLILRNRQFSTFWASQTLIALIGQAYFVTQSWIVLDLTKSTVLLGTLLMIGAIPRVALLPITGMIADRIHPKHIMIMAEIALAVVTAAFSIALFLHRMSVWEIFSFAVVYGVISAIYLPSSYAIIPSLVDNSNLQQANVLLQLTNQTSVFVGAALTGIIIAKFGLVSAYSAMTITTVASLVLLLFLRARSTKPTANQDEEKQHGSKPRSYAEIIRIPLLLFLVMMSAVLNLGVIGPMQVGLPTIAHSSPHLGVEGLGYLTSSFGFGSMVGVMLAGLIRDKNRRFPTMIITGIALGVIWAIVGSPNNLYFLLIILWIAGVCVGIVNVLFITLLQTNTPQHLLGRVMGLQLMGSTGLQPVSLFLSGWAIPLVGVGLLFLYGGTIVIIFCSIGAVFVTIASIRSKSQSKKIDSVNKIEDTNSIREFHGTAVAFCDLFQDNITSTPSENLHRIAFLLSSLYVKALELPDIDLVEACLIEEITPPSTLPSLNQVDSECVTHALYQFNEHFRFVLEKDLLDIYRDVSVGIVKFEIQTYESTLQAAWIWKQRFWSHWGRCVIDALQSVHFVLSSIENENTPAHSDESEK